MYDGSVTVSRTNGTISARCDNEAMNILALNLAYDIINTNKNVNQARSDYGMHAMAFMKGEKPAYTQNLNFNGDKSAPDPDQPLDMTEEKIGIGGAGASGIEHSDTYCAKMKDGKFVVMYEGNVVTADATLSNGIVIRTDGTVVKQDGSTITLKEGECIDKEGKIIEERMKAKTKKDNPY
jgi:hypothetical protein